jgi:hypothetical protein
MTREASEMLMSTACLTAVPAMDDVEENEEELTELISFLAEDSMVAEPAG